MASMSRMLLFLFSFLSVCLSTAVGNTRVGNTKSRTNVRTTHKTSTRTSSSTATRNDPYYSNSWYFEGDIAPSINIECLWEEGLTGKGVKVLVIDDSFDFTHPDLVNIEYSDASYNYITNSKDVAPTSSDQWHGTPVAGIIAATHNNGICGVGVAPGALISGRVAIFDDTTVEIMYKSLSENLGSIDIISNSWGIATCEFDSNGSCANSYCHLVEDVGIEIAVKEFATSGRNGKGGIVIFAAGDTGENEYADTNLNPATRIPYAITVGSVNSELAYITTSPKGKSLFITAPGEDPNSTSGIVGPTTTCTTQGQMTQDCTENLVGSGASAPIVAGVVALMLEAKSDLTSDEVRQILMNSARKIDKEDSSWTTNSAGVTHSTRYGFGYIDAAGAIEMARKWTTCGCYTEQTTTVNTSLSSYYQDCLSGENIEVVSGATVLIPFFMKSLGSVIIDSMSVTIGNIVNSSVEIGLREDQRYCNTSVISKEATTNDSDEQMPFSTIITTNGDPNLANQCSGTLTLTTYQYAGMSSSGNWTLSIKNNGTTKLSIPLSSLTLTARGYPSIIELSSPVINYENDQIKSITITPSLNDPGLAAKDYGRGMRVYIWVDGNNPIPVTNSDGTNLVVDVLDGDIEIPWDDSYNTIVSSLSTEDLRALRVILVDNDEEYSPFTFNSCHTIVSPIVVVVVPSVPPTEEESVEEEEECIEETNPPIIIPEEECEEIIEEICEEEEEIPSTPILPPDEEETSDGFTINPNSAARIISLLSAFLIAMIM